MAYIVMLATVTMQVVERKGRMRKNYNSVRNKLNAVESEYLYHV